MAFSYIFVGSTHGFINDFLKQREVIKSIKPEFVLCEDLEDLKLDSKDKFKDLLLKKREISNMTSFDGIEELIKFCFGNKIKLVGIDIHNFGFDEDLQNKIKNKGKFTKEDEKKLDKVLRLREKHHLARILEYKEKTAYSLVVVIGCWHLRKNSFLRKNLKNYKIIAPLDENGEVLFEPDNNKEIKFGELISNDDKVKD